MRFGLVSLLALAFRTLERMRGGTRELALPTGAFWAANIVAAKCSSRRQVFLPNTTAHF
jgi:hypothetical protein